jgi:hypothetical protein
MWLKKKSATEKSVMATVPGCTQNSTYVDGRAAEAGRRQSLPRRADGRKITEV